METIRIAIDGPSGAGKSTLARSVAAKLGRQAQQPSPQLARPRAARKLKMWK